MSTSEEPIPASIAGSLPGAAAERAELVGVRFDAAPRDIADAINRFLTKPKKRRWFSKVDNWE